MKCMINSHESWYMTTCRFHFMEAPVENGTQEFCDVLNMVLYVCMYMHVNIIGIGVLELQSVPF